MKDHGNDKKSAQLGMHHSKARNRLTRMILFELITRHGENGCYRCGEIISTVKEMSVEHKEAWLDVDPALYWDMSNIAFSHLSCNSASHRQPLRGQKPEPVLEPTVTEKECSMCHVVKPAGQFSRRSARPSGLQPGCKQCFKERYA